MDTICRVLAAVAVSLTVIAGGTSVVPTQALAAPDKPDKPDKDVKTKNGHDVSCGAETRAGYVRCHSKTRDTSDTDPTPLASTSPVGLSPALIKRAYAFPAAKTGAGKTIAIVVAYHYPTAAADLAKFSQTYGLTACPVGSCFTQVNQTGGTAYPAVDPGWALEAALDVQWAHAIAPGAKILLVEATTNSYANLMVAVDYARKKAQYVSVSWGSPEFYSETSYDYHFTTPAGVAQPVSFFVSSGDDGLPAQYPSSSPNVVSVGGTRLANITTTSVSETAWSGGGGGCSSYESATTAQKNFAQYASTGCNGRRATPDVSLDADPASGVSVYNSTPYSGQTGWYSMGGTSASAPMWAGRSAGEGVPINSTWVYSSPASRFRDIITGSNGAAAKAGYDMATGRGSWIDPGAPALAPPPPPPPVASFTTSCSATTCTFRSTSTGTITSYLWSGAVSGTSSQVTKTFATTVATHTVNLKVSNSGGSSTATDTVSCYQPKKGTYACS